jgi:hypothetical protein
MFIGWSSTKQIDRKSTTERIQHSIDVYCFEISLTKMRNKKGAIKLTMGSPYPDTTGLTKEKKFIILR